MSVNFFNPIIVIPARLAAVRLPNKPLADIEGKPMVVRVWEQACKSGVGPVIVACDGKEIAQVIRDAGGESIITDPNLLSGSDRVYAAVNQYDPQGKYDVVINLQGDLPNVQPQALQAALLSLKDPSIDVGTTAALITDPSELDNINVVKIAMADHQSDQTGRALYFSRNCIPHGEGPHYHHIGIYAYRRDALAQFVKLPQSQLELRERLEQLRLLGAGLRFGVGYVKDIPVTVDTPEDLERARRAIKQTQAA